MFLSYKPLYLVFGKASVAVKGGFSDGEYHILIEPLVHPHAKSHSTFFGEVNISVKVEKLVELL